MIGPAIAAAASIAGGLMQRSQQQEQMAMQKTFAKNAIQWKVKDATKAGIHPLYALGANTVSFSPSAVGDLGIGQAGQDISRAIGATQTAPQRAQTVDTAMRDLALTRAGLENDLLRTQIASGLAKNNPTGPPPPMAGDTSSLLVPGQAQAGTVEESPMKRFELSTKTTTGRNLEWSTTQVGQKHPQAMPPLCQRTSKTARKMLYYPKSATPSATT